MEYVKTDKLKIDNKIYGEDEKPNRNFRRLIKDGGYYFSYEKIEGGNPPHDLRLQLKKIMHSLYRNTKIKDIPEEREIVLKLTKQKYLVIFENKDSIKDQDIIFNILKFKWIKGIEDQEYGIYDD